MLKIGRDLLEHPYRAMGWALLFAVIPFLGFLSGILTGFLTLCRGYKAGLIVLLGVLIPPLVLLAWKHTLFFDFVLLRCVLIWGLAGILRRTASWRLVLEVTALVGVIAVVGFHLMIPDAAAWWLGFLRHYEAILSNALIQQIPEEQLQSLILQMSSYATGLLTALILASAWLFLWVARAWQSALFRPGEWRQEFVEIRGGILLLAAATLCIVAAVLGSAFALDLLPVIILPLAIVGISCLHAAVRYYRKWIYLLIAVYVGLIFLSVYFVIFLALIGYVDCGYDLRKRFINKKEV